MQVMVLMMFTLVGMGLLAAVSMALYAGLPRTFLECAELHGRFRGLLRDEPFPNGTPTSSIPEGFLSGQAA